MESPRFSKTENHLHSTLPIQDRPRKTLSVDDARAPAARSVPSFRRCRRPKVPLNGAEKRAGGNELLDEVFGLGPLEPLLKDPTISDSLVNNRNVV